MKRLAFIGVIAIFVSGCSTGWTTTSTHLKEGVSFYTAKSPVVTSIKPIRNPRYGDGQSYIYVECMNKKTLDIAISFSFIPILDGREFSYDYDISKGRFKWDNQYENVKFGHGNGAHELIMDMNPETLIKKMTTHKKGILELNLVSEGIVEFPYSFKNASESITKIRKVCELN